VAWLGSNKLVWGSHVNYWEGGGKPVNHDKPAGAVLERDSGKVLWRFKANVLDRYSTLAAAENGNCLGVIEIPGQPRGAFLLDGDSGVVLMSCYDKAHGSGPLSIGISPQSKRLAVGYAPHDIILWDARTGEWQNLLEGHSNWVVSLAFSADGKRLISGAGDSSARVWDVESGTEIGRLRFEGASTYVDSVGFSPKGDLAFALTEQRQFVVAKVPARKQ
jgi:WD40 repeat protein